MDESVSTADAQARVAELERTLESLREDSEVAYVLLGLSGALAEVRSLEETIALAVRTIPGLFGADRCLAATWDAAAGSFDVLAHWGYEDADVAAMLERAEAPHGFPVLRKALQERTPVFESAGTLPPDEGILSIPLIRWGEDFGGLRLGFSRARTFTARDSALARGVARQLGVALDNARRFNLLRGLRGFGLRVGSQLRLAEVIEESVAGTIDLLVARGAWLYFLDSTHKALVTSGGRSGSLALPERLARVDLSEEPWAGLLRGE
ncbi:MAG TPA: GAF domain-containing protein, partial [Actinomycetota bacterium]|nr:GAF domain-containing protein [Actinomycetota bacterium]